MAGGPPTRGGCSVAAAGTRGGRVVDRPADRHGTVAPGAPRRLPCRPPSRCAAGDGGGRDPRLPRERCDQSPKRREATRPTPLPSPSRRLGHDRLRGSPRAPESRCPTSLTLDPRDITRHERIPVTTPARTILDLAAILDEDRLEQACAEAHARGLAYEADLRRQLDRNPGRRGAGRLRALLDRPAAPARTRSPLERTLLKLIRASDLPDPETDQQIGPYVVDFLWREERLIVETDGRAFHSHDRAKRRDRRRTNDLQLRGYTVLRFTSEDVGRRPAWVLGKIRAALALRRAR